MIDLAEKYTEQWVLETLGPDFELAFLAVETNADHLRVRLDCVPRSREAIQKWPLIVTAVRARSGVPLELSMTLGTSHPTIPARL